MFLLLTQVLFYFPTWQQTIMSPVIYTLHGQTNGQYFFLQLYFAISFFFARILTSIAFPVPTLFKSPTQNQNKVKYAHISISNFFFSIRFKNKQQKTPKTIQPLVTWKTGREVRPHGMANTETDGNYPLCFSSKEENMSSEENVKYDLQTEWTLLETQQITKSVCTKLHKKRKKVISCCKKFKFKS